MEKRYLVFTHPINERLLQTAPKEFYRSLSELFDLKLNAKNTDMVTNALMAETRAHVFEDSDYIGWFLVVPEGTTLERTSSTKH